MKRRRKKLISVSHRTNDRLTACRNHQTGVVQLVQPLKVQKQVQAKNMKMSKNVRFARFADSEKTSDLMAVVEQLEPGRTICAGGSRSCGSVSCAGDHISMSFLIEGLASIRHSSHSFGSPSRL